MNQSPRKSQKKIEISQNNSKYLEKSRNISKNLDAAKMEVKGKLLLEQPRSLKKSQNISKYLEKSRNMRKHAKMCIDMLICTHDKGRHTADSSLLLSAVIN